MDEKIIYHISNRKAWEKAQEQGVYRVDSLDSEGFIHFSTNIQILDTANRYYRDEDDLILLCVEVDKLKSELKYERSGEGVFPHVYGPFKIGAVVNVLELEKDKNGKFVGPVL